jgi:hypothetical protein
MPDNIANSETWVSLMRAGSFESAWRLSDEILKSGMNRDYMNIPRHYQCIWDGTPPDGKTVLIRCYHGLGDTIQFIRYATLVRKIAREVIVWTQPKLIPILEKTNGIDRLLPLHEGAPGVDYDVDVEIMELAHVFRTDLKTIPLGMPYIHVETAGLKGENFKIGLVWESGDWDLSRSVPFTALKILFTIEGIDFYILQDKAEAAGWEEGCGIHPGICTLYEHAQIIKSLDLLITVDTMTAHLAGAMNVPVWVMLPYEADWRWMEGRADSPWYPSMKLFRQKKAGDWENVVAVICRELRKKSS